MERKNNKNLGFAGHPRIDSDLTTAMSVRIKAEGKDPENVNLLTFFSEGNETVQLAIKNVEIVDRGGTDLDHHIAGRSERGETATSLMIRKLGLSEEIWAQQLQGHIKRSDIEGITDDFTLCDFLKCLQRDRSFTDKQRLVIGYRVVDAAIEFKKRSLQRDNSFAQSVLISFLSDKKSKEKRTPKKFERYFENLTNDTFRRSFDFAEILAAKRFLDDDDKAIQFGKSILQLVYDDSIKELRAEEVINMTRFRVQVRDKLIIANDPDVGIPYKEYSEKFGPAARKIARDEDCVAIAIQRDEEGRTQIFFDTNAKYENREFVISDGLIEDILAAIRLQECLAQGRKPTGADLAQRGTIDGIPEWYYFCPPQLSGKRPGRSIFNGSLTAPDVPRSKLDLGTIYFIVHTVTKLQPLDWQQWAARMISLNLQQK